MKEEITRALSEPEKKEKFRLEEMVHSGFTHMRDCAKALKVLRDKRLYRDEFNTFQEYCAEKWGKERRTVNLMIEAWEARKEFGKLFPKPSEKPLRTLLKNTSDLGIRELKKVPDSDKASVLKKAADLTKGRPTADSIKTTRGPCSEFQDGKGYRGHSMSDFYVGGPARAETLAAPVLEEVIVIKRKMLEVYDAEIAANLKTYKSREDMAARVRVVLEKL